MGWDNGARIADVNGDGLPDIIQSYSDVSGNPHYAAWLNIGNSNTGNAWAPDPAWNPPDGALFDTDGGYDGGVRVADVLGDGLPAIISSHVNINNTNVSAAWTNNNVVRANILTGVSYPQGGSTQITYQAAAQSMNAEPYPIYTVSKITNNDGLGNLSSSTYQYANGTYYYANPTDHEFAGFKLVTQTDGAGNVTKTYYHTANGIDSAGGEYHDNFWKIGKAYRVENYDNAGHLYKAVITQWNSTSTGGNAAFVFPDQTIEMDYDGLSTHKDSAESYTWDVTNGNEIQKVQWGQVTESNDGAGASSSKSFEINTLSGGSLTNGLVSYYNLEGNANDYYGSNNGASNNALYGTNYGKVGQGAEFGSGKYIQLPSYLVAPTDSTSINLWFYQLGSGSGNQPQYSTIACGQSDSSENGGYWWACISGTAAYITLNVSGGFAINGTRYQLDSGVAIPVNAWTMVTITYDRSTMRIYVNGVLRNSIAASGNIVPYGGGGLGPLRLGREQFAGDNDFNGYEDEPSVWNRALTANEISDLYNAGAGQTMVGSGYTIVGTKEYITNITYASSTNSNIVGKVSDETMLNGSSTKIQETQYYYDGLGIGGIGAGNLTAQDDWVSGGTYVTSTRNAYNSYGLVAQSFDPRNNTTTYSYDNYNLYPATTTNALGQTVGYQYDYSTGKPTQTINPNGLKFQTLYDGLGRPLQVLQPDQATTSTLDLKAAYTYIDTANAVSVHESDYLNASTTVDTYRYYDGLGRLIQTRKSATDAGIYKVSDQLYNNVGLVQKQSLPYFASSSTKSTPTTTAALFTTFSYDPLGRVITTADAVGTTTNYYNNWKTTVTDPNGNQKDTYHDAYGNLVQVGEHNGSSTYTTTYIYDGLQNLLGLTDANGNVRSFAYDGLGREVSSTDLHAPASSTYGIWNYNYDNAGNLTSRVDPKNQTVNYSYDALNRVLTENYAGASTTAVTYIYDTCTNGIGRLCTVSSTNAVSLDAKTYDPLGNLASETKTINGTNYTTSYTYDRQGNQLTITNPDNSVVQYTYGTGGLITNVQEKESGGSFANIVTSIDYSPMDKMVMQTDANGVTTINTYDPTRLYRLNNTVTTLSSGQSQMKKALGGVHGLAQSMIADSCTGALTTYTVPPGVTQLLITAFGAQGGGGGGLGGGVSGTLAVTSGTTYYINVGCQNGYNGGGASGGNYWGNYKDAGAGGGMTWISANSTFTTSTVLMVAGGGGGVGGYGNAYSNGPGGGGTAGGSSGTAGGSGYYGGAGAGGGRR